MRCVNCGYAEPEYDKDGTVTGITCTFGDRILIPINVAVDVYCGAWTEADE